jgi:hypothetical protein
VQLHCSDHKGAWHVVLTPQMAADPNFMRFQEVMKSAFCVAVRQLAVDRDALRLPTVAHVQLPEPAAPTTALVAIADKVPPSKKLRELCNTAWGWLLPIMKEKGELLAGLGCSVQISAAPFSVRIVLLPCILLFSLFELLVAFMPLGYGVAGLERDTCHHTSASCCKLEGLNPFCTATMNLIEKDEAEVRGWQRMHMNNMAMHFSSVNYHNLLLACVTWCLPGCAFVSSCGRLHIYSVCSCFQIVDGDLVLKGPKPPNKIVPTSCHQLRQVLGDYTSALPMVVWSSATLPSGTCLSILEYLCSTEVQLLAPHRPALCASLSALGESMCQASPAVMTLLAASGLLTNQSTAGRCTAALAACHVER